MYEKVKKTRRDFKSRINLCIKRDVRYLEGTGNTREMDRTF